MGMMQTHEETATNGNASSAASVSPATNGSNAKDSKPEFFVSTSDCSVLTSPSSPALTSTGLTVKNDSFIIKRDTDYSDPDADFLKGAVSTFEDRIAACASYNQVLFCAPQSSAAYSNTLCRDSDFFSFFLSSIKEGIPIENLR